MWSTAQRLKKMLVREMCGVQLKDGKRSMVREMCGVQLKDGKRSMVREMCGVQLKDGKRSTDLLLISGLNEMIDELATANSVRWYGHVLRREDGHV